MSQKKTELGHIDAVFFVDDNYDYCEQILITPRLAFGSDFGSGLDEVIPTDLSDSELADRIDLWKPTTDATNFARIVAGFGSAAIRPIAQGLATQLDHAIHQIDAGSFAPAHRLTGLAGTLGFSRVSRAWMALNQGDTQAVSRARREARLAQAALARWLDD